MTHLTTTAVAAAADAGIVLPDRAATLRWTREHTERLGFVLTRAELRAAWKAAGLQRTHHRAPRGRKDLAADLACHDAQVLARGEEDLTWLIAWRAAAAARVAAVGTATWIDLPRAFASARLAGRHSSPAVAGCGHLWIDADPTCQHCAAKMATISPSYGCQVADVVWARVTHRYGLSIRQSDAALGAVRELISRRLATTRKVYDPWMR